MFCAHRVVDYSTRRLRMRSIRGERCRIRSAMDSRSARRTVAGTLLIAWPGSWDDERVESAGKVAFLADAAVQEDSSNAVAFCYRQRVLSTAMKSVCSWQAGAFAHLLCTGVDVIREACPRCSMQLGPATWLQTTLIGLRS